MLFNLNCIAGYTTIPGIFYKKYLVFFSIYFVSPNNVIPYDNRKSTHICMLYISYRKIRNSAS